MDQVPVGGVAGDALLGEEGAVVGIFARREGLVEGSVASWKDDLLKKRSRGISTELFGIFRVFKFKLSLFQFFKF